jgi:hypothetical protein
VIFILAVTVTIYHPMAQNLLETEIGKWLSTVPRTLLAIVGNLVAVHLSYEFAPHLRPRRNWPLAVGVLTCMVYIILARAVEVGLIQLEPLQHGSTLPDLVFDYSLLVLNSRVLLPAFAWAAQHEQQRAMRLRFVVTLGVHIVITLWMITGLTEATMIVFAAGADFALVYVLLAVVGPVLCIAAYLVPASYFVSAIQMLDHASQLLTFVFVHHLELRVAQLSGEGSIPRGAREILTMPSTAIYRSVIATFDLRKLLRTQPSQGAQILAARLDAVARPELEYPQVVQRLRQIGRDMLFQTIRSALSVSRVTK